MLADRKCCKLGIKMFFGIALASSLLCATASAQQLAACGSPAVQPCIPKFVDPLPIPPGFQTTNIIPNVDSYEIAARQISQQVLSTGAVDSSGNQLMTTVFAYGSTGFPYNNSAPTKVCAADGTDTTPCFFYPAPIITAFTGKTVHVRWFNDVVCHTGDVNCTPGTFLSYPGVTHPGGVTPSFTNHTANPSGICNGKATTPSDCKGVGGYSGPVPLIVHLHGVDTSSQSDGIPEAWNVPRDGTFSTVSFPMKSGADYCQEGPDLNTYNTTASPGKDPKCATGISYDGTAGSRFVYPNRQYGTLLFFHDHALGVTTENVYMGLAGPYILKGTNTSGTFTNTFVDDLPAADDNPPVPAGLPASVPLVITDKAFNTDGSLKFSENGNVIVVNGKTWPFFNVEPRKYRLRLVIGAPTSRFDLTFPSFNNDNPSATVTMTQIGADQGYLPHPATVTKVSLMPGERADVIVDFASFWVCNYPNPPDPTVPGCTVQLLNANGSGDRAQVMQFNVVPFANCPSLFDSNGNIEACAFPPTADTSCQLSFLSCTSRDTLPHRTCTQADCANPSVRQVSLFDDHLGNCPTPGCVSSVPLPWDARVTETPTAGTTETWEMYDFQDTHPMHLHLATFQVVNRESMSTHKVYNCTGMAKNALGNMVPCSSAPVEGETGFKDTVQASGGQITRVKVLFYSPDGSTNPGLFAWHCHINPHEDNEMMRPMCVHGPDAAANATCDNTP